MADAARILTEITVRLRVEALLLAIMVTSCVGRYQSDFPVVVVNNAANTLQVLANGNQLGQVTAGESGSFSLHLAETNANVYRNGVAPTPQAEVGFSARDTKTGAISPTKSVTLSQSAPTYVAFTASDFPSAPTVARFSYSPLVPQMLEDVYFNASSSSVSNGTFFWDFADGQTGSGVTVSHVYSQPATFTVLLLVTGDSRQSSNASRTVTVVITVPPDSALQDRYGDVVGTCGSLRQTALVQCVNNFIHGRNEATDFEVVKRVAWILRNEGGGLLVKTAGENIITWRGYSFSTSRLCAPLDHVWKVFRDAGPGGANTPAWDDEGPVAAAGDTCIPAINPNLP